MRRHGSRHTGLTWRAEAGVPVHVLRKLAGHGWLMTTQRYLHPDVHLITSAGEALSAHLRPVPGRFGPYPVHGRFGATRPNPLMA
ncbi:tyrosine-type recombinase/integrase [Embleya sp. NPDC059237]|uniref:tyrosine-type recombinase/integrase n=1 Tax=Embleya sp. NPDC059237 TaxID=3346784 RepID=UPI0036A08A94